MPLDPLLIEILVDPEDKEPLWYFERDELLYNPRLCRSYAVREGIPVMLISEAVTVDAAAHERWVAEKARAVETGLGPKREPEA